MQWRTLGWLVGPRSVLGAEEGRVDRQLARGAGEGDPRPVHPAGRQQRGAGLGARAAAGDAVTRALGT